MADPVVVSMEGNCHPLCRLADQIADRVHAADNRMFTGEPYITHPRRVRDMARELGLSLTVQRAAVLHDTLEHTRREDRPALARQIEYQLGKSVIGLVLECTDVFESGEAPRAQRIEANHAHAAQASPDGQTIKLLDSIDNVKSVVTHSPKFAAVYVPEKIRLWGLLETADPRARAILAKTLVGCVAGVPGLVACASSLTAGLLAYLSTMNLTTSHTTNLAASHIACHLTCPDIDAGLPPTRIARERS